MTYLPCPVCGEQPVYTVTFAGNHSLRCDGTPPGCEPRHTIYVLRPTREDAVAVWSKAAGEPKDGAK